MSSASSSRSSSTRPPATEADLLAQSPDGPFFELIDGQLVPKASSFAVSLAKARLPSLLWKVDGHRGDWWLLIGIYIRLGDHILRPDLAGWRRESLPVLPPDDEEVMALRPDWVCEVLTPGQTAADLVHKMSLCLHGQIPFYWIIDPQEEKLSVYSFGEEGYTLVQTAQRGDRLHPKPFDEVELDVGAIFAEDEDE